MPKYKFLSSGSRGRGRGGGQETCNLRGHLFYDLFLQFLQGLEGGYGPLGPPLDKQLFSHILETHFLSFLTSSTAQKTDKNSTLVYYIVLQSIFMLLHTL